MLLGAATLEEERDLRPHSVLALLQVQPLLHAVQRQRFRRVHRVGKRICGGDRREGPCKCVRTAAASSGELLLPVRFLELQSLVLEDYKLLLESVEGVLLLLLLESLPLLQRVQVDPLPLCARRVLQNLQLLPMLLLRRHQLPLMHVHTFLLEMLMVAPLHRLLLVVQQLLPHLRHRHPCAPPTQACHRRPPRSRQLRLLQPAHRPALDLHPGEMLRIRAGVLSERVALGGWG